LVYTGYIHHIVIYTYQVKNKSRKYHSMKSINYKVKEK
jgi:hypothetical protein